MARENSAGGNRYDGDSKNVVQAASINEVTINNVQQAPGESPSRGYEVVRRARIGGRLVPAEVVLIGETHGRITRRDDRNGWIVLGIAGELDVYNVRSFRRYLIDLMDGEERASVVLETGELEFADSTGLGVIFHGLMRRCIARSGTVRYVADYHHRMTVILRITGLAGVMNLYADLDSATRDTPEEARAQWEAAKNPGTSPQP
jgi:anti-anti-sigma factor